MSKSGRNDSCPCGSGKKYKQCCLRKAPAPAGSGPADRQGRSSQASDSDTSRLLTSALAAHHAGKLAQAEALYRAVLRESPKHADAMHLLGLIACQANRYQEARELITAAIRLDGGQPGYHSNLGLVEEALHHIDEAEACYRRALAIDPGFAEANSNLGGILASRRALDEAVVLCRRAIKARPDMAEAWTNLGLALNYQDQLDHAVDSCRNALRLRSDCVQAHQNLGLALARLNRQDEAIASYERALAIKPDHAGIWDNLFFAMLYRAESGPMEIYRAHRRYAAQFEAPLRPRWPRHVNDRDPDRRLRIGYVSPDFRVHSVAYFTEPFMAHHDRERFEIHAYHNHYGEDDVTTRIRAGVDQWIDCRSLSDDELAARILADGIDILVDLAGHSANNRLLVFARKPAPVQVTYLGYPATTGLDAIDWRLTTPDVDPEGSDEYYSERLWRLPRSLWCYRPAAQADAGIAESVPAAGRVCFGSMNNFSKVSTASIALWSRLLRQLPESRLVMTHVPEGSARRALIDRFASFGIDAGRLQLHERLPAADFGSLVKDIDIALDPFPYTGTTTTCESLWLGVPVVTLIGAMSVSRSGYALLKQVGLEALCAGSEDAYVDIAVGLARDPGRLRELRAGLRARMAASPLRDEAGFTRELEAAYRGMWRAWCALETGR